MSLFRCYVACTLFIHCLNLCVTTFFIKYVKDQRLQLPQNRLIDSSRISNYVHYPSTRSQLSTIGTSNRTGACICRFFSESQHLIWLPRIPTPPEIRYVSHLLSVKLTSYVPPVTSAFSLVISCGRNPTADQFIPDLLSRAVFGFTISSIHRYSLVNPHMFFQALFWMPTCFLTSTDTRTEHRIPRLSGKSVLLHSSSPTRSYCL